MLQETNSFPTTSQPSPGDFADKYRQLAKNDPDILSIHLSSGLSGTLNSARLGAEMVPEANVTVIDFQDSFLPSRLAGAGGCARNSRRLVSGGCPQVDGSDPGQDRDDIYFG